MSGISPTVQEQFDRMCELYELCRALDVRFQLEIRVHRAALSNLQSWVLIWLTRYEGREYASGIEIGRGSEPLVEHAIDQARILLRVALSDLAAIHAAGAATVPE